jgi:hypothetical protein
MMDLDTSELLRPEELEKLNQFSKDQFVPLPKYLDEAAKDILGWRDRKRKELARKRNKLAKNSRRKNLG